LSPSSGTGPPPGPNPDRKTPEIVFRDMEKRKKLEGFTHPGFTESLYVWSRNS
jgi:hypothetical protein